MKALFAVLVPSTPPVSTVPNELEVYIVALFQVVLLKTKTKILKLEKSVVFAAVEVPIWTYPPPVMVENAKVVVAVMGPGVPGVAVLPGRKRKPLAVLVDQELEFRPSVKKGLNVIVIVAE